MAAVISNAVLSGKKSTGLTLAYDTSDSDYEIIDWRVGGSSIAALNIPFHAGASAARYKDYSTNGATPSLSNSSHFDFNTTGGRDDNACMYVNTTGGVKFLTGVTHNCKNPFSISFWVKIDGNPSAYTDLVGFNNGSLFRLEWAGGEIFRLAYGGNYRSNDIAITYNTWHHLVIGADGTNYFAYLNGSSITCSADDKPDTGDVEFAFCDVAFNRASKAYYDDMKIFKYAISTDEIALLYNGDPKTMPSSRITLGEVWRVAITGNDATEDGITVLSNELTVSETSDPLISAINPDNGSVDGGTPVTLTGEDFLSGAEVTFGGVPATDVIVVSPTSITCITPPHAAEVVDVVVTNTDTGTYTLINGYRYKEGGPYSEADTIYNKNRLHTGSAWLALFELDIPGISPAIKLARNNEDITWSGSTWAAYPIDIGDVEYSADGHIPEVKVRVSNITRAVQAILEETTGAIGSTITLYLVYSDRLDDTTPVQKIELKTLSSVYDEKWVEFTCGLNYPPTVLRPLWRYIKYICPYKYGDIHCGISAATKAAYPTCNKTLANCKERGNDDRIGSELGIPGGYYG